MAFFYLCPHCGKRFDAPGICPICKITLLPHSQQASSANRFCTQCGAPLYIPNQLFCTCCGTRLDSPAAQPVSKTKPQKKKFPLWGIAGIVFAVLLILIIPVTIFRAGFLIPGNQDILSGQWDPNHGGYVGSNSEEPSLAQTNARALIVSLTYGTGEEFGCVPSTGDFVEIGLNIINTQDRTITLSLSNFYLTEDSIGKKINPYSQLQEESPIQIEANSTVVGAIVFAVDPDSSYHFHFVESDGTLISSYELSK